MASASPRRSELLARVGIAFDVIAADIDESQLPGESPINYVARMATSKAEEVFADHNECAVLAADTVVFIDGDVLGKPRDIADAGRMLRALCGTQHRVATAFALLSTSVRRVEVIETVVTMRAVRDDEVESYLASGEWQGKAGGYAIQGIAAALVTSVAGSVTNVIGLPLAEVIDALEGAAIVSPNFAEGAPA